MGVSDPKQCPYACHMHVLMQLHIAPSSMSAVAHTGELDAPVSLIYWWNGLMLISVWLIDSIEAGSGWLYSSRGTNSA